mmetsp:Transcript_33768/g.93305  ORF Transcript_33768/g.93305 Transcript_33768/m.93305 type:complete len:244 (-) Transcript_33768:462-1193(-)
MRAIPGRLAPALATATRRVALPCKGPRRRRLAVRRPGPQRRRRRRRGQRQGSATGDHEPQGAWRDRRQGEGGPVPSSARRRARCQRARRRNASCRGRQAQQPPWRCHATCSASCRHRCQSPWRTRVLSPTSATAAVPSHVAASPRLLRIRGCPGDEPRPPPPMDKAKARPLRQPKPRRGLRSDHPRQRRVRPQGTVKARRHHDSLSRRRATERGRGITRNRLRQGPALAVPTTLRQGIRSCAA